MSILDGFTAFAQYRGSSADSRVQSALSDLLESYSIKNNYPILDMVIEIMLGQSAGARRVNDLYDEIEKIDIKELNYNALTEAYKPVIDLISKLYDIPFAVALKVAILAFPHDIDMMNVASARLA